MAKRYSYEINGEAFDSKTALTNRCREILCRFSPGEQLSADDEMFMRGVLKLHVDAEEKHGAGIKNLWVRPDDWGKQCFEIERVDGTRTDFSFIACVSYGSAESDLKQAMRATIRYQILAFKRDAFGNKTHLTCPVTGETVTQETCHIDHETPGFDVIASLWLQGTGLDLAQIALSGFGDGEMTKWIVDDDIRERWQTFHLEHAKLRVVSVRANLSVLRKASA